MAVSEINVSVGEARRFLRRAHLLDAPVGAVGAALARHGYVQIDPLNVCGRMHDLILRNRVADYREGDLMRHLHGEDGAPLGAEERTAFEHHLPSSQVLVAFGDEAWPHLQSEMVARARRAGTWSGRLTSRENAFARELLAELATRGPLSSGDLHDGRRAYRGWGASTLAKTTLQKLFFHGRVLIAARKAQRRYYALPERVLPAATRARTQPDADETARWLVLLKLRQHRLVALRKAEVARVEDRVRAVVVENGLRLYCLREDVAMLTEGEPLAGAHSHGLRTGGVRLLAPLDPLIYNRGLTSRLWGFDYTWEVYTPAQKRVRGYYALPLLAGEEFIGHVDPKMDRETRRLVVQGREVRRGFAKAADEGVRELARFLGARETG